MAGSVGAYLAQVDRVLGAGEESHNALAAGRPHGLANGSRITAAGGAPQRKNSVQDVDFTHAERPPFPPPETPWQYNLDLTSDVEAHSLNYPGVANAGQVTSIDDAWNEGSTIHFHFYDQGGQLHLGIRGYITNGPGSEDIPVISPGPRSLYTGVAVGTWQPYIDRLTRHVAEAKGLNTYGGR